MQLSNVCNQHLIRLAPAQLLTQYLPLLIGRVLKHHIRNVASAPSRLVGSARPELWQKGIEIELSFVWEAAKLHGVTVVISNEKPESVLTSIMLTTTRLIVFTRDLGPKLLP
jgi:hypothetical protein